jgi:hypothetical protein
MALITGDSHLSFPHLLNTVFNRVPLLWCNENNRMIVSRMIVSMIIPVNFQFVNIRGGLSA